MVLERAGSGLSYRPGNDNKDKERFEEVIPHLNGAEMGQAPPVITHGVVVVVV